MSIHSLRLNGFLSYGPDSDPLELQNLNVLIGPNGSGKSNLIEAIELLAAMPRDLAAAIRYGGGPREWLWKGSGRDEPAEIEAILNGAPTGRPLRHRIQFTVVENRVEVVDEAIEALHPPWGKPKDSDVFFYYRFQKGRPLIHTMYGRTTPKGHKRSIERRSLLPDQSILSQRKDSQFYPEVTWLGRTLSSFYTFREWTFGRTAPLRRPQQADLRNDILDANGMNLGLVLSSLRRKPETKRKILDAFRHLYDGITDYEVVAEGGTLQIFIEEGNVSIPAVRLSDGTLRFLCLLAILCDPNPPPLVCIEEPELGLHPDILTRLTDLMREASQRCQLVVTTHSDMIVDALTDTPESIVVCEKEDGQTRLKRLSKKDLSHWLEKYRLGELWSSGQIGGNRW